MTITLNWSREKAWLLQWRCRLLYGGHHEGLRQMYQRSGAEHRTYTCYRCHRDREEIADQAQLLRESIDRHLMELDRDRRRLKALVS